MKQTINEILEAQVLQIVNTDGQYVALKRCVLCRPLKAAAHRLVQQKVLVLVGEFDGKLVWEKAEG